MPIEYSCAECRRSLRVPDEAAGKQARCPDCGAIQQAPRRESPFRDPENAWFQPAVAPEKTDPAGEVNPYQAPPLGPTSADQSLRRPMPRHIVAARVQGPAIALMAISILMLAFFGFALSIIVYMTVVDGTFALEEPPLTLAGYAASGLMYIVMLIGALHMRRLRNYALALTAAVLAVLPCSGCCIVSMPCGIWALVVLLDANVRAAFE